MEHEGNGDSNCNCGPWNGFYRLGKAELEIGVGNWRTNQDHLNYSIAEIDQNIEKSPGLVSLFNGISTFVGYLMPKPFS